MAQADIDQKIEGRDESLTVVQASLEYIRESYEARRIRLIHNGENRDAYFNRQNWDGKIDGQSTEFLPKTQSAVEQFSAFIKRALTQFGPWFTVEAPNAPISPETIRQVLMEAFDNLPTIENKSDTLATKLGEGSKQALLETWYIFKVYGSRTVERRFFVEEGELVAKDFSPWRLHIDLIAPENFGEDPRGRGLYRYHECERDMHVIRELSGTKEQVDDGEKPYLKSVVDQIENDYAALEAEYEQRKRKTEDTEKLVEPPSFRKRIGIHEFWGDLIDSDGNLVKKNQLWSIANKKYLIRPPQDNPYWHGRDPFVVSPLIRYPHRYNDKALFDAATDLNVSLNELFNLMLDGGLASVWGMKQARADWIDNADEMSDGIPQGWTAIVNDQAPPGAKVLEQVSTGNIPPEALQMYSITDREFNASALTNDIKMGMLPPKQVKATEIVESQQSSAVTLDSIAADIELNVIVPILEKSWFCILQYADEMSVMELSRSLGLEEMLMLARMSPAERFADLGAQTNFKATGLSGTLARLRDFQRLMAVLQAVSANPVMAAQFWQEYSSSKIVRQIFRQLNLNPENFRITEDDGPQLQMLSTLLGAQTAQAARGINSVEGGGGTAAGEPGTQSEVNQELKPTSGL